MQPPLILAQLPRRAYELDHTESQNDDDADEREQDEERRLQDVLILHPEGELLVDEYRVGRQVVESQLKLIQLFLVKYVARRHLVDDRDIRRILPVQDGHGHAGSLTAKGLEIEETAAERTVANTTRRAAEERTTGIVCDETADIIDGVDISVFVLKGVKLHDDGTVVDRPELVNELGLRERGGIHDLEGVVREGWYDLLQLVEVADADGCMIHDADKFPAVGEKPSGCAENGRIIVFLGNAGCPAFLMDSLCIVDIVDAEEDDWHMAEQIAAMLVREFQCSVVADNQGIIGGCLQFPGKHVGEALDTGPIRMVLCVHVLRIDNDARSVETFRDALPLERHGEMGLRIGGEEQDAAFAGILEGLLGDVLHV